MKIISSVRNNKRSVITTSKKSLVVFCSLVMQVGFAQADEDYTFDSRFLLGGAAETLDLARFSQANSAIPGIYSVEIKVNEEWKGQREIAFSAPDNKISARPCYSRALLEEFGVDFEKIAREVKTEPMPAGSLCDDISRYIPEATLQFDVSEQLLSISVPQLYIKNAARGYVPPSQWDKGVSSARLGYNFNSYRSQSGGMASTSNYLGLNSGINLGDWRLRHNGSLTWGDNGQRFDSASLYAQRHLPGITSQLVVGDSYTAGQMFDSYRLKGVRVYSDDRMLPDSQVGFAPVVRGVARTNAKVTVRQRDYILYETTVPPGPFEINDLAATGYSGDLQITVTEADGDVQTFTLPFTSIAQLLRPGHQRFDISAGILDEYGSEKMKVTQLTWQRGLNNTFTGYGGLNAADSYQAATAGVAVATPVGGFSLDLTGSRARLPAPWEGKQGLMSRVSYNKNITETGTNLALAAYRYSTEGYLSLNEAAQLMSVREDSRYQLPGARSRFDVTLSQALSPEWGSFYLSGSYINGNETTSSYIAGYNTTTGRVSWGISAQQTQDRVLGRNEFRFGLNLSLPLGDSESKAPRLTGNYNHARDNSQSSLGINGFAGESSQYSYDLSTQRSDADGNTLSASGTHRSSMAEVNASYAWNRSYKQMSGGISGVVVAHPEGMTLGQQSAETLAIVSAPQAGGAQLLNTQGITLDSRGYAVMPYLMPYRINQVEIDPKGISQDVELKETTAKVAPTAGALVMLKYNTVSGKGILLDGKFADGEPLPFGADIVDGKNSVVGIVGQSGRAFIRLQDVADAGHLRVVYDRTQAEGCPIGVGDLAGKAADGSGMIILQGTCSDRRPASGNTTVVLN